MGKKGIYENCSLPWEFCPVTYGHLDIITRACDIFDRVYVFDNPAKKLCLHLMVEMLSKATRHQI